MQINLPDHELLRLATRIEDDRKAALGAHAKRMARNVRSFKAWRNRMDPNPADRADDPNYVVPLTKWHVQQKQASVMEALLGDDSEIVAVPVGPSDQRRVRKISRHMTWRVFESMDLTRPLSIFSFRTILFGNAHVYLPWERRARKIAAGPAEPRTGDVLNITARPQTREIVDFEGTSWVNIWPDDLIVPNERASSIHDFSFVLMRSRATFDDLVNGAENGRYNRAIVRKHHKDLLRIARTGNLTAKEGGELEHEAAESEGVTRDFQGDARDVIQLETWFGRWRMLKPSKGDSDEDDLSRRETVSTDLEVTYCPELHKVIGVQALADMYPYHEHPRPFGEASLGDDGTYWKPGFGEMLEEIEIETTAIHNLGVKAGELSVSPPGFYEPSSGISPERLEVEPGVLYPVANAAGVRFAEVRANLEFPTVYMAELKAIAERVSGQSDFQLGRQSDRPNAPRTVGQTQLLLQAGDVRNAFDMRLLRNDFARIIRRIWLNDVTFLPNEFFFRVTEEDPESLFEVDQGFARIDSDDLTGRYDFDLKFATSAISKEAAKERALQLYQIDIGNPLIVENPRALWRVTREAHRALGDDQWENVMPEPPDNEPSLPPREEHARMMQGEDVEVRPADDDKAHLLEHDKFERMLVQGARDADALERLQNHKREHAAQMRQKMLMQVMVQQIQQDLPSLVDALAPQQQQPNPNGGGAPPNIQ